MVLLIILFALLQPAGSFGAVTRVAVTDFENRTGDAALNWIGIWLADALRTDLARIPDFKFVERKYQTAKTAGVQTMISGEFQKMGNDVRLTARAVDVETRVIRAIASVDGAFKDVIAFPHELAAKLAVAMKESPPPAPAGSSLKDLATAHAFSDGVYYFRNGLFQDALAQFDDALAKEPDYADAQFYKGLSLEKLGRWDDAIGAFKRALPRTQPASRLKWRWDAPFTGDQTKRGIILGLDTSDVSLQRDVLRADRGAQLRKQVIYAARNGKNTVLHFVNLEEHTSTRLELPDNKLSVNDTAIANSRLTLLVSADLNRFEMPAEPIVLYAVGSEDGTVWWHSSVKGSTQLPLVGVAPESVYVYFRENGSLNVFADRTQARRWMREGIAIDPFDPPKTRSTRANGAVMILKTANTVQAVRLSDGKDVWIFDPHTANFTQIVTDHAVILFDPGRRVTILDIETGKRVREIPVPQFTDNLGLGAAGSTVLSGAIVESGTLYFLSKTLELYAVTLDGNVRWHTPTQRKFSSLYVDHSGGRVYAGTQTGELLILDETSGTLAATVKLAAKNVVVHHADSESVVVSSEKALYGLQPWTGTKRWEFPIAVSPKQVAYFKGIVAAKTSGTQLSALDAHTGAVQWQYAGKHAPTVFTTKDAFYVVAEDGIKEYAADENDENGEKPGIADEEVWTELANALLSKGDVQEAENVAARIARVIDPDSAAWHAVRARLEKAKGNRAAIATHLGAVVRLAGTATPAGQEALAELKGDHEVMWYEPLSTSPIGDPVLVGDRLISIGRSATGQRQLIALNPDSGKPMWRQSAERFSDVVTDPSTERAWQVSGDSNDSTAAVLYALDLGTGERKRLARWTRRSAVSVAAIAYEKERLFIATVAPDLTAGKVEIAIDCFNTAGTPLWTKTDEFAADLPEMQLPLGLFAPHGSHFVYSVGPDLWTLNAANGSVAHHQHENAAIAPRLFRNAPPDPETIYYLTAKNEIVAYHAARGVAPFRIRVPEMNFNFFVREMMLYGTDTNSVFAFDLNEARVKWRVDSGRGLRFLKLSEEGATLCALGEDGTLQEIDRTTGVVQPDRSLPWPPSGLYCQSHTVYAFGDDGAAFAMRLASR